MAVLVIDQGGHGSRALVFDDDGQLSAQARASIGTRYPAAGQVEQDPLEILRSVRQVLGDVAGQLGSACSRVSAAALIVQRSSVLAWQRDTHEPLSPVLSWQDTRHAAWLDTLLDGRQAALRDQTGLFPNAHYGASKLRWLLDHVPAVSQAQADGKLLVGPLAAFLQQQLTGAGTAAVDAVIASRMLLTALGGLDWEPGLLALFGIPATVLPSVTPSCADYGHLVLGDCRVPLQVLGGDQAFFALSHSPAMPAETVFINAGTGAFVQQRMAPSAVPPRLLCSPVYLGTTADAQCFVAEGTVNAAATALDWWWEQSGSVFSEADWHRAARMACEQPEAVPLFCNRLVASGSPDWQPAGHSHFSAEAPVALQAIAVLESIVFAIRRNLDCLAAVQPCRRIVLSGGLSQLVPFCQSLADVSGLPVWCHDDPEACARGAAVLLLPQARAQSVGRDYLPSSGQVAVQRRYQAWQTLMGHADGASRRR